MTTAPPPAVAAAHNPCDPDPALWAALRSADPAPAQRALLAHYRPLAEAIASAALPASSQAWSAPEREEVRHLGQIGLLHALAHYDPARGTPFAAFAAPRIRGNVIDGIRRLSEVHAQIAVQQRWQRERLHSLREGTPPATGARAAARELTIALALGHMLEDTGLLANGEAVTTFTPYHATAWVQTCRLLRQFVASLPDPQDRLIALHYFHAVPFAQIQALLGLSQGRISQLHTAALAALRGRLTPGRPALFGLD